MTQISGIESVRSPLAERDAPSPIENNFDTLSERFHRLVDKEFLGTLTPEEEEELKKLTLWHNQQGELLYQSMMAQ